ncbi:hypothetical protein BJV82DRAFT_618169 [Fennellomyces sp. T-0311]|nr:hypothetical protein BJV82DRAFT_618169 [Fennellomyces sp. T-0311]
MDGVGAQSRPAFGPQRTVNPLAFFLLSFAFNLANCSFFRNTLCPHLVRSYGVVCHGNNETMVSLATGGRVATLQKIEQQDYRCTQEFFFVTSCHRWKNNPCHLSLSRSYVSRTSFPLPFFLSKSVHYSYHAATF